MIVGNRSCEYCGLILVRRHQIKYCSVKCQKENEYLNYINDWKSGSKDGNIGISAKNISRHLKRYLLKKYKAACCLCGWNKINQITGRSPLEIDHINGKSEDNSERNLRLVCPNCHSLTNNFKNLNRGKGRKWRMVKYKKNQ